jgi:hypothetical protein
LYSGLVVYRGRYFGADFRCIRELFGRAVVFHRGHEAFDLIQFDVSKLFFLCRFGESKYAVHAGFGVFRGVGGNCGPCGGKAQYTDDGKAVDHLHAPFAFVPGDPRRADLWCVNVALQRRQELRLVLSAEIRVANVMSFMTAT